MVPRGENPPHPASGCATLGERRLLPGCSSTGRLAIPTSAGAAGGGLRRDVRVIGLVGGAHFVSHFFQLTLPPLFPLLRDDFGVTYVQLGLVMSLFYASSGIGQTASGFLVDHFGARRVLPAGMALVALAMALAGLAPSYWALVAVALLGGLGNSVFHPADYSIFNASVSSSRLGPHGIAVYSRRLESWKIASGRKAETVTFGRSTTFEIRRSTATLQIT